MVLKSPEVHDEAGMAQVERKMNPDPSPPKASSATPCKGKHDSKAKGVSPDQLAPRENSPSKCTIGSENCDPNLHSTPVGSHKRKLNNPKTSSKSQEKHKISSASSCENESASNKHPGQACKEARFDVVSPPHKHICRSRRCAANNPDYAVPAPVQPKKYLVSKRHLLQSQDPTTCKCCLRRAAGETAAGESSTKKKHLCFCRVNRQSGESEDQSPLCSGESDCGNEPSETGEMFAQPSEAPSTNETGDHDASEMEAHSGSFRSFQLQQHPEWDVSGSDTNHLVRCEVCVVNDASRIQPEASNGMAATSSAEFALDHDEIEPGDLSSEEQMKFQNEYHQEIATQAESTTPETIGDDQIADQPSCLAEVSENRLPQCRTSEDGNNKHSDLSASEEDFDSGREETPERTGCLKDADCRNMNAGDTPSDGAEVALCAAVSNSAEFVNDNSCDDKLHGKEVQLGVLLPETNAEHAPLCALENAYATSEEILRSSVDDESDDGSVPDRGIDEAPVAEGNEGILVSAIEQEATDAKVLAPETEREKTGNWRLNAVMEAFQNLSPTREGRVKTLVKAFESLMSSSENEQQNHKPRAFPLQFSYHYPSSDDGVDDEFKDAPRHYIKPAPTAHSEDDEQRDHKDGNDASASKTQTRLGEATFEVTQGDYTGSSNTSHMDYHQHMQLRDAFNVDKWAVGFSRSNRMKFKSREQCSGFPSSNVDIKSNSRGMDAKEQKECSKLATEKSPSLQSKQLKGYYSKPQPFKLRTEERGMIKEYEFAKKLEKMFAEEERLRLPIAQGLPWTTDEPEILPKPPVKEQTKPIDFQLYSDIRAMERAEFDAFIAEKLFYLEQRRLEDERLCKIAEEEEIKRMRQEMVPKAQLMPYFDRPFRPKRSSKRPTIPKEPQFHHTQAKRPKCTAWDGMHTTW